MENVYSTDWDSEEDREGFRSQRIRLGQRLGGEMIGATIYSLEPGQKSFPYHVHYANEELLLMLEGSAIVRTPAGENEAAPGDAIMFKTGPAGAHQVINRSSEPARYIMFSTLVYPEVARYPDSGNLGVIDIGHDLRLFVDGEATRDYYHGED
jgi:uncharacterized cupin superfamily protein